MESSEISHYKILNKVGFGSSSNVYEGFDEKANRQVAIKVINKINDIPGEASNKLSALNEISQMRSLSHTNIIQLYDVVEDENNYYIIMEFAPNGSLSSFIMDRRIDEKEARGMFRQIASAVHYLHYTAHVVHRDLKVENILLDEHFFAKVSDFGFSRKMMQDENFLMSTRCGSPCYASPEIIQGSGYTEKTDVWSLGVVLYVLITGNYPFFDRNIQMLFKKIVEIPIVFPPIIQRNQSLKKLLEMMLCKKPENRATMDDVMNNEWLASPTMKSESLPQLSMRKENLTINQGKIQCLNQSLDQNINLKMNLNLNLNTAANTNDQTDCYIEETKFLQPTVSTFIKQSKKTNLKMLPHCQSINKPFLSLKKRKVSAWGLMKMMV